MSPLMLQIMMHYYIYGGDCPYNNSEAGEECLKVLLGAEMIYESPAGSDSRFHGNKTALGVFFQKVLSTPLPEKKWVLPDENDRPKFLRRV